MEFKDGEQLYVVHFGELWLRGRNRNQFVSRLLKNMREQLSGEKYELVRTHDRMLIRLEKKSNVERIGQKLGKTFGISKYELAYTTKADMKSIKAQATKMFKEVGKGTRIKIESHRSYKQHKFDSKDIISALAAIAEKKKLVPTPRDFTETIYVSVTKDITFMHLGKKKGAGGMPVGTAGKGVILLSGGIDSPVAAWYAMKRGVIPIYVHFHGYAKNTAPELKKIDKIIEKLNAYYPHYKLYLVPTSLFQMSVLKSLDKETILLKSFMLHVADKIAEEEEANLIYTGDCLAQVASQTSANLYAENYGIKRPIMRPLIGFDKEEITAVARRIDTYECSLLPYKDVCSINASNPNTHVDAREMEELVSKYKIKKILPRTLKLAKVIEK